MKKVLFFFAVVAMTMTAMAQEKVAILETVDKSGTLPYGIKLLLRSSLTSAISNTPGYEGYDRVDMASIAGEQEFQRTGNVSDNQIKQLGVAAGASYVLVAEAANYDATNIIITAKLLDVETFGVKSSAVQISGTSSNEMERACEALAKQLLKPVVISPKKTKTQSEGPIGKAQLRYDNRFNSKVAILEDGRWVKCSKNDAVDILAANSNPEVVDLYLRGWKIKRRWRVFELVTILGTAGFATSLVTGDWFWDMEANERNPIVASVGGACIVSVLLTECIAVPIGKHKMKKALKMYNTPTVAADNATLSFGLAPNGVGMTLHF